MGLDLEKLSEALDLALQTDTKEDLQKFLQTPLPPKGWVSIEEFLPRFMAADIRQGYSVYKVKDIHGNITKSAVCDHNVWYYEVKQEGITHWLNE